MFDSTEGDFHYDIIFQTTTTLQHCRPSLVLNYRFVNYDFSAIKPFLGYDTYVVGRFLTYKFSATDKYPSIQLEILAFILYFVFAYIIRCMVDFRQCVYINNEDQLTDQLNIQLDDLR